MSSTTSLAVLDSALDLTAEERKAFANVYNAALNMRDSANYTFDILYHRVCRSEAIAHGAVLDHMGKRKFAPTDLGAFAVWISNQEINEGHALFTIRERLLEIPRFPFLQLSHYLIKALESGQISTGGFATGAVCSSKWFQTHDKSLAVTPRQLKRVVHFCREVVDKMVKWERYRPSGDDLLSDTLGNSMQKHMAELETHLQRLESVLKTLVTKQRSSTRGSGSLETLVGASISLASVVTDIPAASSTPVHTKSSSAKETRDRSLYNSLMYAQSARPTLSFSLSDLERSLKTFSIDENSKTTLTRFWTQELARNGRKDDREERSIVGTS